MFIDAAIAILLGFYFLKGFRTGIIKALVMAVACIVGLVAALKLSSVVAVKLSASVNIEGKWLPLLSFLLVFIAVVWGLQIAAKMLQETSEAVMLGWANRLGGAILYALIAGMVASVVLFYATQMHFIGEESAKSSILYPHIAPLAPKIINGIGAVIPVFKDMFLQLEQFFEGLSNKMGH